MKLETPRTLITEFDLSMAPAVHLNSLDEDTRRFLPDEVFETVDDARETIEFLMTVYASQDGPLVYPVLLKDGTNIGYVQLVPVEEGFEVGYHIGKAYTCRGYATEALSAFLSYIMPRKQLHTVWGICDAENVASLRVLEKCGFELIFKGVATYQGQPRDVRRYVWPQKGTL